MVIEGLVLFTLVLITSWGISLYKQVYKPFLISTVLLLLVGIMWYLTTPASNDVVFGFSAVTAFPSLAYIGLGLGVLGILYIIKG